MTTLRPNFPTQETGYFAYLASYGIPESTIANCCIKEADIAGIDSRNTVIVGYNEQEFSNIPVLVHTDIGTRVPLMQATEQTTVTDYFKDAALMFPEIGTSETKPIVYAAVDSRTEEVVAVVGIKRSAGNTYPDQFPTYKPFVQVTMSVYDWNTKTTSAEAKILYDVLVGDVAQIPTYTSGVPGLPFLDALGDPTDSVFTHMSTFITDALSSGAALTVSSDYNIGIREPEETVLLENANTYGYQSYPVVPAGTPSYSTPDWTITDYEPEGADPEYQYVIGTSLSGSKTQSGFNITCSGSYSRPDHTSGPIVLSRSPAFYEVAGMDIYNTTGDTDEKDPRASSRILGLSDGTYILRQVDSSYTDSGTIDGTATVYLSFMDGETTFSPRSFTVNFDHFDDGDYEPIVSSRDYHYSSYNVSYLYGCHFSIFAMTVHAGPGVGLDNRGILFQVFEAPNTNSLIQTQFIKDLLETCYTEIESDYLATPSSGNRYALSISSSLYFVPCDTRVAKLMLDNSIPY